MTSIAPWGRRKEEDQQDDEIRSTYVRNEFIKAVLDSTNALLHHRHHQPRTGRHLAEDRQQPCKAPAPKKRLICIPSRLTYTTHPSAPRMQRNSERMAGCAVTVSTQGSERPIWKLDSERSLPLQTDAPPAGVLGALIIVILPLLCPPCFSSSEERSKSGGAATCRIGRISRGRRKRAQSRGSAWTKMQAAGSCDT